MKKPLIKSVVSLIAVSLALSSTPAMAQTYLVKLNTNTPRWQLALESPAACDGETGSGIDAWYHAGGSKFETPLNGEFFRGKQRPGVPGIQVTFQPGSELASPNRVGETRYGRVVGSVTVQGQNIPIVDDADIVVNSDYWASGTLDCDAAATAYNQFDFAKVIGHEMGHVVGMSELYDSSCLLYYTALYGVALGSVCSTEASGAYQLYRP